MDCVEWVINRGIVNTIRRECELFRDAILLTSERLGVSEDIVEKDYYVTLILKKLSSIEYPVDYIRDALGSEEKELIETYDLETFPMRVQSLNRTLIDKVFAVCDYYMQGKDRRNARHLYDIYKLTEHVKIDEAFLKLVNEVRLHRIEMGSGIAPAAPLDVNILELVQKHYQEMVKRIF